MRCQDVFGVLLVRGPDAGTWVRVRVMCPVILKAGLSLGEEGNGKVEAEQRSLRSPEKGVQH